MKDGVTTMGAIADQMPHDLTPAQQFYYKRLLENYNRCHIGWRNWNLRRFSYQELFGPVIDEATEEQILLALPLPEMNLIFGGDFASMRVCDLRALHSLLLRWEFGRAMIVQPRAIHDAIHIVDHYSGLYVNPLVNWVNTQERVCSSMSGLHEHCDPAIVLRRGPWAQGPMTHAQTVQMWDTLPLSEAIAGVQGQFHECDLFPDF